ncbi:MAG: hypothetical protein M1830_008593 [Pleopsidium flavum]|nr:MAG: hypothetical protein M1830_008593 [Pleopsidium flavum]
MVPTAPQVNLTRAVEIMRQFFRSKTPAIVLQGDFGGRSLLQGTQPQFVEKGWLGTWKSPKGEVKKAVSHAMASGYKHIDCAYVYGNEDEVGEGLMESFKSGDVKREDIFGTTKLWCTYQSRVEENLDMSLRSLGLEHVDLYLMHWPCPMKPKGSDPSFPKHPHGSRDLDKNWSHVQTCEQMEGLLKTREVKAIGVANYSVKFLRKLLPEASVVPAERGIHITASSPLGSSGSPLLKDERVAEVAAKHGVPSSAILFSYHVARGISVLAKSVTPSRIDQNGKLLKLDTSDMQTLEQIDTVKGSTRFVYPEFGVNFEFPDKQ